MGYEGGYSLVQRYVRERKREMRQASSAFLDLVWAPGTAQCDFGEADFWWRGRKARPYYLVLSFPQSNMGWFQVFGGTTAECVCEGLMAIFLHIGGVPYRIVFVNATGIGRRVAGEVRERALFRRFRLHFGFEATFCNPHAGHEKGSVESKVGFVRRNAFVPVPTVGDLAGYNEALMGVADSWASRAHYRRGATWGELFEADRAALVAKTTRAQSEPPRGTSPLRPIPYNSDPAGTTCNPGEATRTCGNHNQTLTRSPSARSYPSCCPCTTWNATCRSGSTAYSSRATTTSPAPKDESRDRLEGLPVRPLDCGPCR